MDRTRYRWPLRAIPLLLVLAALAIWAVRSARPERLTVENQSGQAIPFLRITVAGEAGTFHDIAAGETIAAPFDIRGEEPFTVEGKLADGTLIRSSGLSAAGLSVRILPAGKIDLRRGGKGLFQ